MLIAQILEFPAANMETYYPSNQIRFTGEDAVLLNCQAFQFGFYVIKYENVPCDIIAINS